MSNPTRSRVSAGTPTGGEFKTMVHGDATGSLAPTFVQAAPADALVESFKSAVQARIASTDRHDFRDRTYYDRHIAILEGAQVWKVNDKAVSATMNDYDHAGIASELLDVAAADLDLPDGAEIRKDSRDTYTLAWNTPVGLTPSFHELEWSYGQSDGAFRTAKNIVGNEFAIRDFGKRLSHIDTELIALHEQETADGGESDLTARQSAHWNGLNAERKAVTQTVSSAKRSIGQLVEDVHKYISFDQAPDTALTQTMLAINTVGSYSVARDRVDHPYTPQDWAEDLRREVMSNQSASRVLIRDMGSDDPDVAQAARSKCQLPAAWR